MPIYLAQLNEINYIETNNELSSLCESIPEIPQGAKAYIVRALYVNKHTGDYLVQSNQDSIWVNHESLARMSMGITKSAIIVFSKFRPDTLYITAYAGE